MYESSTKETRGCASNLLAHEDLGQFEEAHHWNIQAKFYNIKFPLVYGSDNIRDSLSWRALCYFEAQVWKKDISIATSLFFSHFFIWAFSFFFSFSISSFPLFLFLFFVRSLIPTYGGIIASIIFSSLGQCSNNDDHHTFIFLTTQYLEQNMSLYECLWLCTGTWNDAWVTCMKKLWTVALPQIQCQLHDHAKQYDNDGTCHSKRNGGKLHGNISRMAMEMPW